MRSIKRTVWSFGLHCRSCNPASAALEFVRPRSRGGSNRASNLVAACIPCNTAKDARSIEEFLASDQRRLDLQGRKTLLPLWLYRGYRGPCFFGAINPDGRALCPMHDLLRTRKQLVREQSSHVLRVQKTLEDRHRIGLIAYGLIWAKAAVL